MLTEDDVTSLDAMRDMDEEDGAEGMAPQGSRRFIVLVTTTYAVNAMTEQQAYETWVQGEAEFIKEDDPAIYEEND